MNSQLLLQCLCLSTILLSNVYGVSLDHVHPLTGPFQGGTVLQIVGTGFLQAGTVCQLLIQDIAVISVTDNVVYNSSFMTCTLPSVSNPYHVSTVKNHDNRITLQLVGATDSIDLILFDLQDIIITDIVPNSGLNVYEENVFVRGTAFVNTTTITCNIHSLSIEGQFINSSLLMCLLPAYPVAAQVHLDVYLNGQLVSQISTTTLNATVFTYFATPPQVIKCAFTLSYASILLSFDREIEIAGSENDSNTTTDLNCNLIFDQFSLIALGNKAICYWLNTQQRDIVVSLPQNTNVRPGSIIALKPTSLRTRYAAFSKHASGNISLQHNKVVLQPKAVLEYPQNIPYCGNITFSGISSLYGGPIPLIYQWNVTKSTIDEEPASGTLSGDSEMDIDPFKEVPEGFTRQPTLSLPSSDFDEHTLYNVSMTVQNFIGYTDTIIVSLLKLASPVAPVIQIIGNTEKVVNANKLITIQAKVLIECTSINSSLLLFHWEIHTVGNGIKRLPLPAGIRLNSPTLQLPANTLSESKVYLLTVLVSTNSTSINSIASLTVYTQSQRVKAVIQGGLLVIYGRYSNIVLDLSSSHGLTDNTNYTTHWYCSITDTNDSCINSNNSVELIIQPLIRTFIPASSLLPGQYTIRADIVYNFAVLSTVTQTVVVSVDYDGPFVYLHWPPSTVHIHKKLSLTGYIRSELPASVQWECISVIGYAYLQLDNLPTLTSTVMTTSLMSLTEDNQVFLVATNATHQNYINPISLVIPPGLFLPDNNYRFRLSVTDSNGRERYADIDVHTTSQPSSGVLMVTPSIGTSLVTHFKLQALYWTDNSGDAPLYYRYGFSQYERINTVWLSGISESSYHETLLPLPAHNTTVNVILEVYDSAGALTVLIQPVTVVPPRHSIDLMELYNVFHSLIVSQRSWAEGLSSLTVVLWSLNIDLYSTNGSNSMFFSEAYIGVFKQASIELVIQYLQSSPLPFIRDSVLTILSLSLNDIQLLSDTFTPILNAVELIVNSYIINNDPFTGKGLSSSEVELVIHIYDQLIRSMSSVVTNNRISTNPIHQSYQRLVKELGYGLCQQLEVYERSVLITSEHFGTLKVYYTIPPWSYNLTCTVEDSGCSFPHKVSSNVTFGGDVFKEYEQKFCTRSTALGNFTECEGICIITTQALTDTHWSGNPFSNYIKATPITIELRSKHRAVEILPSLTVRLSLFPAASFSGTVECVYWNDTAQEWSNDDCLTNIVSPYTVECTCPVSREVAVIDSCPSGFHGLSCNEVCPQGLWGSECSHFCRCHRRGTCSSVNGICDCDPGWTGDMCQSRCDVSHWGKGCSEQCLCDNGVCNHINGSCDCFDGWNGTFCNESCSGGGFYGKDCSNVCNCRTVGECHSVTGECTCQAGYTGLTCNDICPERYYGINCSSLCNCSENGTVSCDHVSGTCYCLDQWLGDQCDNELVYSVVYSPSVTVSIPEPQTQPVWWIAIPAIVIVLVMTAALLIVMFVARRRAKKKIAPISDETDVGKDVEEEEEEENDDHLRITRAKSLVRVSGRGNASLVKVGKFQEPGRMSSKFRWQVIQLLSIDKDTSTHDPELEKELDKYVNDSEEFEEVVFLKGIYLEPTATLKELRNDFIDSNQLEGDHLYFQFLLSDTPGDIVIIDDEEELQLKRFEAQERTVYTQSVDRSDVMMELCVCGKFAELECTECRGRGYCTESCQEKDWLDHIKLCRVVSARRREDKKKRKQKRKEKRLDDLQRTGFTPTLDLCRCGKLSVYECSGCGLQGYCSNECQDNDWMYHKLFCEQ